MRLSKTQVETLRYAAASRFGRVYWSGSFAGRRCYTDIGGPPGMRLRTIRRLERLGLLDVSSRSEYEAVPAGPFGDTSSGYYHRPRLEVTGKITEKGRAALAALDARRPSC